MDGKQDDIRAKNNVILLMILVIGFGFGATWVSVKGAKQSQKGREKWAYPLGVITVGGISSIRLSDHRRDPQEKISKDEENLLKQIVIEQTKENRKVILSDLDAMTHLLEECAARKRDESDQLRSDVLSSFELTTQVDLLGRPMEIHLNELRQQGDLKECIAPLVVSMQYLEFPARMMGISLEFTLRFEVRFLSDEEAMGRGFLYQLAEKKWQETLRSRRKEWLGCQGDQQCTLVFYNCEIDAINPKFLSEYEEAAKRRLKPKCDDELSSKQIAEQDKKAVCHQKLCKVVRR